MNSKICHDTLVGIPKYSRKHQHLLLSIVELAIFYIAKVRFSRILSHSFWYKSHFFTREKMNSKICHDTLVGIPEYFHKHRQVLLSIVELTIFYIAKLRFSRILSHPFWYRSRFFWPEKRWIRNLSRYTCWHTRVLSKTTAHVSLHRRAYHIFTLQIAIFPNFEPSLLIQKYFFDQRKDEFENLSRYTCWHIRVLSKTPAPVALHRRVYHILHCKGVIFRNFEPSLLIQKSFFWAEKRWIRKSAMIHLLAYQSTFGNTSTCCSPS